MNEGLLPLPLTRVNHMSTKETTSKTLQDALLMANHAAITVRVKVDGEYHEVSPIIIMGENDKVRTIEQLTF